INTLRAWVVGKHQDTGMLGVTDLELEIIRTENPKGFFGRHSADKNFECTHLPLQLIECFCPVGRHERRQKGSKLPVTEKHRKNLFIRKVKKGEYMGQAGITPLFVPTEKEDTGGKEIDGGLRKELVTTTALVTLFQGFDKCLGRFRSIGKRTQILPFQRVYPSALFGFIEVDNMETVILTPTVLFGKQIMVISNLTKIGIFQIVQAHGKGIGDHLANDRHNDPK